MRYWSGQPYASEQNQHQDWSGQSDAREGENDARQYGKTRQNKWNGSHPAIKMQMRHRCRSTCSPSREEQTHAQTEGHGKQGGKVIAVDKCSGSRPGEASTDLEQTEDGFGRTDQNHRHSQDKDPALAP